MGREPAADQVVVNKGKEEEPEQMAYFHPISLWGRNKKRAATLLFFYVDCHSPGDVIFQLADDELLLADYFVKYVTNRNNTHGKTFFVENRQVAEVIF